MVCISQGILIRSWFFWDKLLRSSTSSTFNPNFELSFIQIKHWINLKWRQPLHPCPLRTLFSSHIFLLWSRCMHLGGFVCLHSLVAFVVRYKEFDYCLPAQFTIEESLAKRLARKTSAWRLCIGTSWIILWCPWQFWVNLILRISAATFYRQNLCIFGIQNSQLSSTKLFAAKYTGR